MLILESYIIALQTTVCRPESGRYRHGDPSAGSVSRPGRVARPRRDRVVPRVNATSSTASATRDPSDRGSRGNFAPSRDVSRIPLARRPGACLVDVSRPAVTPRAPDFGFNIRNSKLSALNPQTAGRRPYVQKRIRAWVVYAISGRRTRRGRRRVGRASPARAASAFVGGRYAE